MSAIRSRFAATAVLLLGLLGLALPASERVQLTLLSTTDTHGRVYPYDYYTQKPANVGLAKIATLVKQVRAKQSNTLLLDCGDTLQGTPLAYFHNRIQNTPTDPMMLVMNKLGYSCMTLGNHEYNFGLAVLQKARGEATFPWLSANTYKTDTGENAFAPYVVREVAGVKVGIFGLTTPGIPNWENTENYAGLEFREGVSEARKWVKVLRETEKVDVVVGAFHMGLEEYLASGAGDPGAVSNENACLAIARAVPEIDVLFMGHTHQDIPNLVVNGVLFAQAGRWADHLAKADLYLSRDGTGPWKIVAKSSEALPVTDAVQADPEILDLIKPYHEETEKWLSRPIGESARALGAENGSLEDNAIIDLIHKAQLEAGQADVSLCANFNPRAAIPAGTVTVRDISSLYIYENTLYVIEVTGAQLKEALEWSSRYFLPAEPGKTPKDLTSRAIPRYNFDIAEGVDYEIDLRRPVGDRIQKLTFKGAPLSPTQTLRLATNNYRFNGGGGYKMFKGCKVLAHPSGEIRDLIIDWVEKHHTVPTEPTGNWKLVW